MFLPTFYIYYNTKYKLYIVVIAEDGKLTKTNFEMNR